MVSPIIGSPSSVHIPDEIPGQAHPEAAGIFGIPRLFGHVLAGGVEPRDVLDPLAMNRTAQEELAALKDRLSAPDPQHGAHKVAEGSAAHRSTANGAT